MRFAWADDDVTRAEIKGGVCIYSIITMLYCRFHIENWLTFGSTPINTSFKLEPEQQTAMVDAVLQFFTTLLGVRTYLGQ